MIFDTLEANDKNPNTKSQTLFFGIPKGDFLQKVPFGGVWGGAPRDPAW